MYSEIDFTIGDYGYARLSENNNNVRVEALDKTKSSYADISSTVTYSGTTYTVTALSWNTLGACFENCTNMVTAPSIPGTVTDWESGFTGCTALKNVTIPSGVLYLNYTFQDCSSLESITLPSSIISLRGTFWGCTSLVNAPTIPSNVEDMGECFLECTSLTQAPTLPSGLEQAWSCFEGCTSLRQAPAIPENFPGLASFSLFKDCTSLVNAPTIGSNVSGMQDWFDGCTSLETPPNIPLNTINISTCFKGCTSLKTAPEIPTSVVYMDSCFEGCINLSGNIAVNNMLEFTDDYGNINTNIFKDTVKDIYIINKNYTDRNISNSWREVADQYSNVHFLAPQIDAQFDSTNYTNGITLGDYNLDGCGKITSLIDAEFQGTIYLEDKELDKNISDLNWIADVSEDNTDYFYIEALEDGIEVIFDTFLYSSTVGQPVKITDFPTYVEPVLYYSFDKLNWTLYNLGASIILDNEKKVYFRGDNLSGPWYIYTSSKTCITKFKIDGKCKAGGNVMYLRYSNLTGDESIPCDYAFYGLFKNCTSLTTAPKLPATTLDTYCYYYMFQGCTSLISAPELPATTLAIYCYNAMFQGCTSLTTPPELPATTLAARCYGYMFSKCTSLTTPPELPATTLDASCYYSMFQGCTSLTTPPELPATTLASYCYHDMFRDCTSLKTAPELPATTLAIDCYYSMFNSCTSLTTPPELPATTLAEACYAFMFSGCTSITSIPRLYATNIPDFAYEYMFSSIKASSTSSSPCIYTYRIPYTGTATAGTNKALNEMFDSFTPTINTTFYISVPSF